MIKEIFNYGLVGYPLTHSVSDVLHKLLFYIQNNKNTYSLFEVEKKYLSETLNVIRHTKNGFNITIPYKTDVLDYLDYISPEAKLIGSVNTVKTKEGFLHGYNTDIDGIEYCFAKDEVIVNKKSALVIGCGGSALAAVYFLAKKGAKITVCARDMLKLIAFQKKLMEISKTDINIVSLKNLSGNYDIVINCTPVGTSPNFDEMPVDPNKITNVEYFFDLIYNPRKTLLAKNFEKRNIKCRDGMLMLVVQAAKAQQIWENVKFTDADIDKTYFKLALHMFKLLATENINVICLTGFMGSGKTTVGKKLASLLDFKFIDTDAEIEKKYGKISAIFKNAGEKQFRDYETEIFKEALKNKNVVISGGGGIIEKNSKLIKDKTYNIYLECDFFELSKRAFNKSRPLFTDLDKTEELYKARLPIYERSCHLKIDGNGTVDAVLQKIFSSI